MEESVLNTVKKMLGMNSDYTAFDTDVIICINSALMILNQLGVCGVTSITGPNETWSEILGSKDYLESVKLYMYLKVRIAFDPPSSSFVNASFENQIKELEWRLNVQAEQLGE